MATEMNDVVIIGFGLAGAAMAIALNQQGIPCRIYEARAPGAPQVSSGVILTPNGLTVLDRLGVFERIEGKCWKAEYRTYKNDKDETTRKTLITNEKLYGYKNHRLWRWLLLEEMKKMLEEKQVPIVYNAKLEQIVADTAEGVKFTLNGKAEQASMLIGADGIHSTVRKYLEPSIEPEYTGTTGVLGHIKWSTVRWPYEDYEKACTIQGKPGAIFFMPEDPKGSEIMVGKQAQQPDRSPEEWEALVSDKDRMCKFYRERYDEWNDTVKSIIDSVCAHKDTLYLWPFMRMPRLKRWFSETGRVIIVGDAAHALPPSSGQGINQGLEDVGSLSVILKNHQDHQNLCHALDLWQQKRQLRIDEVFDWATNSTNVQRMPEEERSKLIREGKVKDPNSTGTSDDMRWLYEPNLEQYMQAVN